MQFLEHWDPLSLPRGSVRALIALALFGVLWYFILSAREVPISLAFVSLLVLGHYFGARSGRSEYKGRPPLFLPRGSIRIIIIGGFLFVAWRLWEEGALTLNMEERKPAIVLVSLGLIAGYFIRVLADLVTRGRMNAPRRLFENVKAILAIMATAALVIVCVSGRGEYENIALIAVPFIAFYFGSRQGWQEAPKPAEAPKPVGASQPAETPPTPPG